MPSKDAARSTITAAVLKVIPPRLRDALVRCRRFREENGLAPDVLLTFGGAVTFRRSALLCIARRVVGNNGAGKLTDEAGVTWDVMAKDGAPQLEIAHDGKRFILPDVSIVSHVMQLRCTGVEAAASAANLPEAVTRSWLQIVQSRQLSDDEFSLFNEDLQDTPIQTALRVRRVLASGSANVASLVPRSSRYFERLVGSASESSFQGYSTIVGPELVRQLLGWQRHEGLRLGLLLSAHSSLVDLFAASVSIGEVSEALDWATRSGDLFSQVGMVELGFSFLRSESSLAPALGDLISAIALESSKEEGSRFELMSSLFILVDGELAHSGMFADKPPYWRRLASLAHAGLIERAAIDVVEEWKPFSDWALQQRGKQFYLQSLCDLRTEPRWLPDFASAQQLKAELLGRIVSAAHKHKDALSSSLHQAIFGDAEDALAKRVQFPYGLFPGPLEGGAAAANQLPEELADHVHKQLQETILQPKSFISLVNCALVFNLDVSIGEVAARGIRSANYHLSENRDSEQTLLVLRGLAHVAAVTRGKLLADELAVLVRRCRLEGFISEPDALHIALVAAAAHEEQLGWDEFVGRCITDLAFSCEQVEQASIVLSDLVQLLRLTPTLWATCGRAEAALQSLASA